MDANLEAAEIVIAQKLTSGEPTVRKRALRALHTWIKEESRSEDFGEPSVERLCKGLYYVMWMQDKMLLQEELADSIANLINFFDTETQSVAFVKVFFTVLSNEWYRVDRWRMDKFLMLMRRIVRALFARLRLKNWSNSLCDAYIFAFKEGVISVDRSFSEGLKFHFASVYLDELDHAGGLSVEQVIYFLEPYIELLGRREITKYFFNSIVEEVFMSILHLFAEEAASSITDMEGDKNKDESTSKDDGLKFDYDAISKKLFDVGKQPIVTSERRRRLFDLAKKFKAVSVGQSPFEVVDDSNLGTKAITKKDINNAVSRLLSGNAKIRPKEKKKKMIVVERSPRKGKRNSESKDGNGKKANMKGRLLPKKGRVTETKRRVKSPKKT